MESFQNKSYQRHADHFCAYRQGGEKEEEARLWLDRDSVDAWRHERMHQLVDPVLESYPDASWLTVGDGRYGTEAQYIISKGGRALASDISGHLLAEAKQFGLIPDFSVANAEDLSFDDNAFDFVLCKDAYHHCPRPNLALYEMLRVARTGVILIEPNDIFAAKGVLQSLLNRARLLARKLRGQSDSEHTFEESGNYAYRLSRRELEKIAIGLNLKRLAFNGINDAFIESAGTEKMSSNGRSLKTIRTLIGLQNILCKLGLADYGYLSAIVFKSEMTREAEERLGKLGWNLINLPQNPYISS